MMLFLQVLDLKKRTNFTFKFNNLSLLLVLKAVWQRLDVLNPFPGFDIFANSTCSVFYHQLIFIPQSKGIISVCRPFVNIPLEHITSLTIQWICMKLIYYVKIFSSVGHLSWLPLTRANNPLGAKVSFVS